MVNPSVEEFLAQRSRLFGLAYRMLGEAGEAEDVVQDAYLRWAGAARAEIVYAPAWLAKVVTNLCLNRLTSARARRETYVGPWPPESVLTADGALGPLETVEQRDSVSHALLRLMERLTPTERAVFVLREAFAYTHRQIAEFLDVSEANSRQLHGRTRRRAGSPRPGWSCSSPRSTPGPRSWGSPAVSCSACCRWRSSTGTSTRCISRPTRTSWPLSHDSSPRCHIWGRRSVLDK
jgi:RNA polymerase sigma factor (sigma-70 family)